MICDGNFKDLPVDVATNVNDIRNPNKTFDLFENLKSRTS